MSIINAHFGPFTFTATTVPVTFNNARWSIGGGSRLADVTTSASVTGAPIPSRRAATAAGVREALLVTYATCAPARLACSSASGAPGIAIPPM